MHAAAFTLLLLSQGFGGDEASDRDRDVAMETLEDAQEVNQAEKAAMRRRLAEDKVRTSFLRKEEGSILHAIADLDKAIEDQRKKTADIAKKLGLVKKDIKRVDGELEESRARLTGLREKIGRRAAAMLRFRRTPLSELVSRAASPVQARKLRDQLAIVLGFDRDLIRGIEKESAAGERLAKELAAKKTALEETQKSLLEETEAALALREERAALLRAVQGERKMTERLAAEIASAARRLDSEIGVVRGTGPAPAPREGGFSRQKGRLPWPVVGRIEVPFGKRVDPESDAVMAHKGLDIRAPLDEPVRAIFGGKVAYASVLHGFGKVVILDHGEGWFSIYAHLDRIDFATGAEIGPRQVIGSVGETGSVKGPYLYFELRQGKDAVDPIPWLTR